MASAQPGIFALGTASHAYLELDLAAGADARQAVMQVASLREPRTTIGGVNLVVGFRPELWASIAPDAAPPGWPASTSRWWVRAATSCRRPSTTSWSG